MYSYSGCIRKGILVVQIHDCIATANKPRNEYEDPDLLLCYIMPVSYPKFQCEKSVQANCSGCEQRYSAKG